MAHHKNMQQQNHQIMGAHPSGNVMNSVLSSQSSGNISNIQRHNIGSSQIQQHLPQSIIGQNSEACQPNQSNFIINPIMSPKSPGDITNYHVYLQLSTLNEKNNNNMSSIISASKNPTKLSHPYCSNNHNFNQQHTYPSTTFNKNNMQLLQEKQKLGSLP